MDAIGLALARCVRTNLDTTDVFFRYQLNQYVIVQRRTDRIDGEKLTRRVKQAVQELRRELRQEDSFTASVVLARMPEDGESLQDVVVAARRRADLEMGTGAERLADPPGSIH